MTTFLDRIGESSSARNINMPSNPNLDTAPPVEFANDYTAGHILNGIVETLVDEARQSGTHYEDDSYMLGRFNGKHLMVSHETGTTADGNTVSVNRLHVIAPHNRFSFYGSEVSTGAHTVVNFSVHKEDNLQSQAVEFSGADGVQSTDTATDLSRHLAETLLDVVSAQNQEGELSNTALQKIVEPLTTPEVVPHQKPNKKLGNTALSRLLVSVGIKRNAA